MRRVKQANRRRGYLAGLLGASVLILAGCNGTEDSTALVNDNNTTPVTLPAMSSPAAIASASADDYDLNTYGLITGNTLSNWVDNWAANRPAGVDGKLVILQATVGETGTEYITPNNSDVFTYHATEWVETRSNGVVRTKSMVPSGQSMDNFLSKYNIDPSKDMIVCAQGKGGTSAAMQAGRCWYMFRYWGVPAGRLAVLNGGNQWVGSNTTLLAATHFSATGSTPPYTGTASVRDLPQINFALQATLEDMINIIPATDVNVIDDGVFLWDARSSNQYNPTSDADFQSGPVQGHPNGALDLNFTSLLNATTAGGYTYKPKAEISAYMTGAVDGSGNGFIDSTLQGVGAGNAYQTGDVIYTYCETTYRAMITGFATAAILGLPTRFYDGAMTEWHSLSAVHDSNGNLLMPADSPWRTDTAQRSMYFLKSVLVDPPTDSGVIDDAYANTAQQIIIEDLAYKGIVVDTGSSSTSTDTSSGGGSLPANPCGG